MKTTRTIFIGLLLAFLVFQTGCVYPGYGDTNTNGGSGTNNRTNNASGNGTNYNNTNNSTSNFGDNGDFVVVYAETNNSYYQEWEAYFKKSKLFEDTAAGFNDALALPYDAGIVFGECGD